MTSSGTFEFRGRVFPYLRSLTCDAGNNELSIEVPIALHLYNRVREARGDRAKILEIGCTIPRFHPLWLQSLEIEGDKRSAYVPHICIDDTLSYSGVIDSPLENWEPPKTQRYDLIISISKLEHIFDDKRMTDQQKKSALIDMFLKMKSWMSNTGSMLVTIPFDQPSTIGGKNWMDEFLLELEGYYLRKVVDWIPTHISKMKRVGFGIAGNQWKEMQEKDVNGLYEDSVPSAKTVYFLMWENQKSIWN